MTFYSAFDFNDLNRYKPNMAWFGALKQLNVALQLWIFLEILWIFFYKTFLKLGQGFFVYQTKSPT
jgi:hypothetical protein